MIREESVSKMLRWPQEELEKPVLGNQARDVLDPR